MLEYRTEVDLPEVDAFASRAVRRGFDSRRFKDLLVQHFIGQPDYFWGIKNGMFTVLGLSADQCTGYALRIQEILGKSRIQVFGFLCETNPQATRLSQIADGHDFAVLSHRWIIDPWLVDVESEPVSGVFDLLDPADRDNIKAYYGRPDAWVETSTGFQVPSEQDCAVFAPR